MTRKLNSVEQVLFKATYNFHRELGDSELIALEKAHLKIASKRRLSASCSFKY